MKALRHAVQTGILCTTIAILLSGHVNPLFVQSDSAPNRFDSFEVYIYTYTVTSGTTHLIGPSHNNPMGTDMDDTSNTYEKRTVTASCFLVQARACIAMEFIWLVAIAVIISALCMHVSNISQRVYGPLILISTLLVFIFILVYMIIIVLPPASCGYQLKLQAKDQSGTIAYGSGFIAIHIAMVLMAAVGIWITCHAHKAVNKNRDLL